MNAKKMIMIVVALMVALVPALAIAESGDSDADVHISGNVTQGSINSSEGGTIYVTFSSDESVDMEVKITVTNPDASKEYGSATVTVPANSDSYKASVHVNTGATGDFNILVTCESASGTETTTALITVSASVWSNWVTYLAIALIVILVVIALVLHSRSAPRIKADTTFTEIEGKKGEADSSKPSRKPAAAPSTEKKRYQASKPKDEEPVKAEEPKKAQNFTELEAEKKSKKDASAEKPEKLKYKSSRRK